MLRSLVIIIAVIAIILILAFILKARIKHKK